MPNPELQIAIVGSVESLATIRDQVRKFAVACGLKPEAVDEVELAADEAVTNVLRHAYPAGKPARLEVRGALERGCLVLAVRDFGRHYEPKPVTAAQIRKAVAAHQSHGLGRYIIKQCMDSVKYQSVPGKYNETVMSKKLG